MRSKGRSCLLSCVALGLLGLSGATAQEPGREPGALPPYDPPVLPAEEAVELQLLEAVRVTLANDPNLLLEQEDVRFQQGLLQEARGLFDWTLAGQAAYQHRVQELTQSVLQRERQDRSDLAEINDTACEIEQEQEDKIAQVEVALADTDVVQIPADPDLEVQLIILQQLIRGASSPQEAAELAAVRESILTAELEAARQLRDVAQLECVETAEDLARLGDEPQEEESDNATLDVRLDKLFRSGRFFSPFIEGSYSDTQFVGKRDGFFIDRIDPDTGEPIVDEFGIRRQRFIDFGGKNVPALYSVDIGFDLVEPLLRGRGAAAVAAGERAAASDLDAVALLAQHAAAESVLDSSLAYWSLLAAQQRLEVVQRSRELQDQLVEIADILIGADEIPRAERSRVLASQASANAQVAAAARDLVAARLALALAMGIDVEDEGTWPLAGGSFPEPPPAGAVAALESELLAEAAAARRYDVQALQFFVESGRTLALAAQLNLRSLLDLSASLWFTARGEDDFGEAMDNWSSDPSWSLGLNYEKPIGNNLREGQLVQRMAALRQSEINAGDFGRVVRISVLRAIAALEDALDNLTDTAEAARLQEETIAAEMEKLRYGTSTLVDTILTEQQRTSSALALIAARQEVASLLARLRFETGSLVFVTEDGTRVSHETITTLPEPAEVLPPAEVEPPEAGP